MDTVGAYEAKTHLAQLLERVAQGEKITITKHGVPVAMLQPPEPSRQRPTREVIEEMRQFRRGHYLDGLSLRDMIDAGRR